MGPAEPGPARPRPRHPAGRARWVVGASAAAAGVVLTGVVATHASAHTDSGSDDPAVTAADPGVFLPDGRPHDDDRGDDRGYSTPDNGSSDSPVLAPPGPAPVTSSHGS